MKKLLGYKPFHFLLFLVLGIGFQFYTDCWDFGIVTSLCVLLFLLLFSYFLRKSRFFGLFIGFVFFLIGICILNNSDATKNYNYFEKHLTNTSNAILAIDKVLKPGNYHYKYVAEVLQIDHKKTTRQTLQEVFSYILSATLYPLACKRAGSFATCA